MKKVNKPVEDELRDEYKRSDFGALVRGKYAARLADETNIVILEPAVAHAFPNDKAVNDALKGLLEIAETTVRLTRRSKRRENEPRV